MPTAVMAIHMATMATKKTMSVHLRFLTGPSKSGGADSLSCMPVIVVTRGGEVRPQTTLPPSPSLPLLLLRPLRTELMTRVPALAFKEKQKKTKFAKHSLLRLPRPISCYPMARRALSCPLTLSRRSISSATCSTIIEVFSFVETTAAVGCREDGWGRFSSLRTPVRTNAKPAHPLVRLYHPDRKCKSILYINIKYKRSLCSRT